LELESHKLLLTFAFRFNLRHHTEDKGKGPEVAADTAMGEPAAEKEAGEEEGCGDEVFGVMSRAAVLTLAATLRGAERSSGAAAAATAASAASIADSAALAAHYAAQGRGRCRLNR
jgi:hypothetical protein